MSVEALRDEEIPYSVNTFNSNRNYPQHEK